MNDAERWFERLQGRSLRQLRDRLSLAQVAFAVLAVAFGGGASLWALGVALLGTVYAFWRPLPRETSETTKRRWTGVVFIALVASIARAFARLEFLDAGVDFLLLLVVQRFFNRQRTREHLQLLMLGAVLMTIAATINADLNYPILLLAYLPTVFMALIVNHLIGEAERLGARVELDLERRGTRDLPLLWSAVRQVAVVAAVAALVVFVAFPRFGVGAFLHGTLKRGAVSGFGDEVQLGGFGRIKTDTTVVMRITPPEGVPIAERLTWHLRGNTFDRYDGGRWSHSDEVDAMRVSSDVRLMPMPGARSFEVFAHGRDPMAVRDRAGPLIARPRPFERVPTVLTPIRVDLEDIGTDKLFAAEEPIAVRLIARGPLESGNMVYGDFERQLVVPRKQPGPIAYEFLSRFDPPPPQVLLALGEPAPAPRREPYLRVPENLSEEFRTLARRITADANTRFEKVVAVENYLLENYSYSLDQPRSARVDAGADPLEGFLFDTREGHCEYFATAMALLLREVGVPTRNVNGYYGAHYNDIGDFYVVRQADAHSWVEVDFGELGWVTFDPTPPEGRTAGDDAPLWPGLTAALEALRDAYLQRVVGFDLSQQFELFENIGVERSGFRISIDWRRFGGVGLGALALVAVVVAFRRRRSAPRIPAHQRVCEELLARIARHAPARRASESLVRYASRLRAAGFRDVDGLERFVARYEALRFGATPPSPARVRELETLACAVELGAPPPTATTGSTTRPTS